MSSGLKEFLASSGCWTSDKALDLVEDKCRRAGIGSLEDFLAALRTKKKQGSLNAKFQLLGEKSFTQITLDELRRHADTYGAVDQNDHSTSSNQKPAFATQKKETARPATVSITSETVADAIRKLGLGDDELTISSTTTAAPEPVHEAGDDAGETVGDLFSRLGQETATAKEEDCPNEDKIRDIMKRFDADVNRAAFGPRQRPSAFAHYGQAETLTTITNDESQPLPRQRRSAFGQFSHDR